jgi:L-cystine uptake protein TcyP (sodium:dicarboxylate symporter family)
MHTYARRGYFPAFAMGFGTSSSAATMPVTMECGVALKCRPSIVKFVIPLGTNINRDGAALYEAASVLFIAQARLFRRWAWLRAAQLPCHPSPTASGAIAWKWTLKWGVSAWMLISKDQLVAGQRSSADCVDKVPGYTGLSQRRCSFVPGVVQANGLAISAGNVVVIAITATLAAIGSASIPNSALVSMVTVLQVGWAATVHT